MLEFTSLFLLCNLPCTYLILLKLSKRSLLYPLSSNRLQRLILFESRLGLTVRFAFYSADLVSQRATWGVYVGLIISQRCEST